MYSVIDSLWSHPAFTHGLLLGGDVLATIAVGWGIIWEGMEYTLRQHDIARKLVMWGIAVETLCSIGLFIFDESISQAQQREIISLLPRDLSPAQRKSIGDACSTFWGTPVGVISQSGDAEAARLGAEIVEALKKGRLKVEDRRGQVVTADLAYGVRVVGPQDEAPLIGCLRSALAKQGGLLVEKDDPSIPQGTVVTVWVDLKPPSF